MNEQGRYWREAAGLAHQNGKCLNCGLELVEGMHQFEACGVGALPEDAYISRVSWGRSG